jgi:hypothetical protein
MDPLLFWSWFRLRACCFLQSTAELALERGRIQLSSVWLAVWWFTVGESSVLWGHYFSYCLPCKQNCFKGGEQTVSVLRCPWRQPEISHLKPFPWLRIELGLSFSFIVEELYESSSCRDALIHLSGTMQSELSLVSCRNFYTESVLLDRWSWSDQM